MIDINFTHKSNYGATSKSFLFIGETGMTVDAKVPNQAKSIINHAYQLHEQNDGASFTLTNLADFIDDNTENFTQSKGGTIRIVRYYSKLLQTIGIMEAV